MEYHSTCNTGHSAVLGDNDRQYFHLIYSTAFLTTCQKNALSKTFKEKFEDDISSVITVSRKWLPYIGTIWQRGTW